MLAQLLVQYFCLPDSVYSNEAVVSYRDGHQAGSKHAWEAAGEMGDPPGWKEQEEEPEMDRELQSLRRITGGLEEASGKFLSASQSLSVSSPKRF